ncbi:hypothetical protein O181_009697 [Austropuccinia psidii MF-1]|uniref:Uncharacterized protein n=1 Tax=Austropuccinia psidii MF-1 TaxID=1389203 RepID=A0A9Q3BSA1_9BASI|nr:hypothetical protein [Austropuccinia psidii MF-1]
MSTPAIPQCIYACVNTAQLKHTLPLRVIGRELRPHFSNINSKLKSSNQPFNPNLFQTSLLQNQDLSAGKSYWIKFSQLIRLNSPTANSPLHWVYNIPCRDSRILNPTLNLLINSSISSTGGHPTPALHIPQDSSTIFENLQLERLIENYICCPQCFLLTGLTESFTTDQPHCQCHNERNAHDPPCTQSLGKFINSFGPAPKTQTT